MRAMQSDIAIIKARTKPNDNSGIVGVDASAVDVVVATVGVVVSAGKEVAELREGIGVGDEFGEAEF